MKKLLAILLLCTLCIICVFAFTACELGGKNSGGTNNGENNAVIDGKANNKNNGNSGNDNDGDNVNDPDIVVIDDKDNNDGGENNTDTNDDKDNNGNSGNDNDGDKVNDSDINVESNDILGTYYLLNIKHDGILYFLGEVYDGRVLGKDLVSIRLEEEGNAEITIKREKYAYTTMDVYDKLSARYSENGNKYILTFSDDSVDFTIENDILTVYNSEINGIATLKKGADTELDATDIIEKDVYGTYYLYSFYFKEKMYNLGDMYNDVVVTKESYIIQINEDNSVILYDNFNGTQQTGTYEPQQGNDNSIINLNDVHFDVRIEYGVLSLWHGNKITFKKDVTTETDSEPVDGTYYFYSYRHSRNTFYVGDRLQSYTYSKYSAIVELKNDGRFVAISNKTGSTISGSYIKQEDGYLFIVYNEENHKN